MINALLQTEKPIPFEFIINGTFLRTSLEDYLTANGISTETTLPVEYVRAVIPPLYLASFEHDAWVSSVDVLSRTSPAGQWAADERSPVKGQERILSGSFDGRIRVWNMSSEVLAASPSPVKGPGGYVSSIMAVKFISPNRIVSSGYGRAIRIWEYNEDLTTFTASLTLQLELCSHKSIIQSLAVHDPSSRILSGSADHTVCLWSTKESDAPRLQENSTSSKRRKLSATTTTVPRLGPLSLLQAHSDSVSSVAFDPKDSTVAYSTSWDHTVRTWDLPTSSLVDTRTTSHPLFSFAALPDLNLLAAGSSARHITLVDPRASATTVSAMTLRGHRNTIVSLARDPDSAYGLVSGSHDGTCRIWDVRSRRSEERGVVGESVYTIFRESGKANHYPEGGEGVKVFGVAWDRQVGIVSASEDKRVQINKGRKAGENENS